MHFSSMKMLKYNPKKIFESNPEKEKKDEKVLLSGDKFLHWTCVIFGFYSPGLREMISSTFIYRLLYCYSTFVTCVGVTYILGSILALILIPVPIDTVFRLLRRVDAMTLAALKLVAHNLVPSRRHRLENLFRVWHKDINKGRGSEFRQELLSQKLKPARPVFASAVFFGVGILVVSSIPYLYNRHAKGSNILFNIPHDPNASYHFLLAWLTEVSFLNFNFGVVLFNYHVMILLAMADAQVIYLKQKLGLIFSKVQLKDNGEMYTVDDLGNNVPMTDPEWKREVSRVRAELGSWIVEHKFTMKWVNDITQFMTYLFAVKVSCFGVYACLLVLTLPDYMTNRKIQDLFIIFGFVIGHFPTYVFETALVTNLCEHCSLIFEDVYDQQWFIYPNDIRQSVAFICSYPFGKIVEVRAFYIFPETMVIYKSILQWSYQALSLLLNMS